MITLLLLAHWSTCVPIWTKNPITQKYYQVCSYYWVDDKKDVGFGTCPAFQHSHADSPGVCFRDDNDLPIPPPPDPKKDLNG